jgi:GntR family transcriptional regulator/MocR family aminotransferase
MILKAESGCPIYKQLYESIREQVLTGRLKSGAKLPSTRELASDLGVSRNTVLLAYNQLLAEGYIQGSVGSGTYVSAVLSDARIQGLEGRRSPQLSEPARVDLSVYAKRLLAGEPLPPPGWRKDRKPLRYDFQYGVPAMADFPDRIWQRLVARRLRVRPYRSYGYGPPEGYQPLREAVADYVRSSRGVQCAVDQVLIVNGSQQGLDLTSRILLNEQDRVVIENPHYQGARQVFVSLGARLIPIPVDEDGLRVDLLRKQAPKAKLAYVTPSHQFPSGAVLPVSRRLSLLAWARESCAYIIEDDYGGEFRYEGWPVPAIQGLDDSDRVIYVGTFSKSLFPSLRIGFLVVPPELIKPVLASKFLSDRQTPLLEQEVLAEFIQEGHFERHIRRTRTRYAARRKALLDALQKHLGDRIEITGANAGIHILLWLKNISPRRLPDLVDRAAAAGVGIYPVTPYYLKPPSRAGLLLGYISLNEDEIRAGIRLLATILS